MTPELFVKMVLDKWYTSIKSFDGVISVLTDDALQKETAPGKNRGVYLLGHMIAAHDDLFVLLDLGERVYPHLQLPFLKSADKVIEQIPTVAELRECWKNQCEILRQKFDSLQPEQWFQKHTAIAADDFIKEPHRNKLNVLLTRITHLTYHTGKVMLLK